MTGYRPSVSFKAPLSARYLTFFLGAILLLNLVPLAWSDANIQQVPSRNGSFIVDEVPLPIQVPQMDPNYVIICPVVFKEEVIPLAVHRIRLGLPTSIYTIESIESNFSGVDREQKVHNFLRSLHQNYSSFKWLFIVGDSEHLRPRALWHYAYDRGQPFHNYYYSDVYYAGLDHDWDTDKDGRYGEYSVQGVVDGDIDWDITVGRLPASTEEHASNYINKLIRYERDPPVGSWMGRFLNWGSLMEPPNRESGENMYWSHKSNAYKVVKKVEANLPDNLEVKGLYDYPQLEGGNYTVGDGRDTLYRGKMMEEFNGGASMLNFVGQARYEAYALNDYGPPTGNGSNWAWNEPMRYSDHSLFTNGDMMPFMYASTCDTAKFFDEGGYNDMSLETWLTSASGGVIGFISSTGTSARGEEPTISWGNWYLDEEFWKLFFGSGECRPGSSLFMLKEQYEKKWLSPTMEIKETILGMLYTYILLGDPWVDIYTAPAERFMLKTGLTTPFFQGEHTVRFQVFDRDVVPVNEPTVTFYNDRVFKVLKGDANGWVNTSLDLGISSEINITFSGHNMVPAFYKYHVENALSDISIGQEYSVTPSEYDLGDRVRIDLEVNNLGGMISEDAAIHVVLNGGNGDPSGHYSSIEIGDVEPLEVVPVSFNWTVRPGSHIFSILVDSSSPEIDPLNNQLEVQFINEGPSFLFNQGSGTIRPNKISPPGMPLTIDYNILNTGPIVGSIDVQLFSGDPKNDGTALSEVIPVEDIPVDGFGNGTIRFESPDSDVMLYLIMDPMDHFPPDFTDYEVRSLLEINYPPRWTDRPEMAILEDSEDNRLRLDTLVADDDDQIGEMVYELISSSNMTSRIVDEGEDGTYLVCTPLADWFGDSEIIISVSDGLSTDLLVMNVTVTPVNDDPYSVDAVQGVIELVVLEDELLQFKPIVDDIDSTGLYFGYDGTLLSVDTVNGTVSWRPGQEDVGVKDHEVTLYDPDGGHMTIILRITVIEVNDPPVVGAVEDIEVNAGGNKKILLQVVDEEEDTLTYGSSSVLVWIDEEGLMHINGSSDHIGTTEVRVFVMDGLNTIYLTFNVTITGDGGGSGSSGNKEQVQYILGGIGIALAVIALLFLGFIFLRRTPVDGQVEAELEDADKMYDDEISALDEEYFPDDGFMEE